MQLFILFFIFGEYFEHLLLGTSPAITKGGLSYDRAML